MGRGGSRGQGSDRDSRGGGDFKSIPDSMNVFDNERKSKESDPDMFGTGIVVCQKCDHNNAVFASGWWNPLKKKKGDYLRLSFREDRKQDDDGGDDHGRGERKESTRRRDYDPDESRHSQDRGRTESSSREDDDDNIPF